MKFRVEMKATKVVEVEADTREEAEAMAIHHRFTTPTVSITSRWADAADLAQELIDRWIEAGTPDNPHSTYNDETGHQASCVREWAIGQGVWPMDEIQAESVWDEICDILED